MVQISWAIHDARGECLHYDDYLIQPKGFEVTDVHYQVHGISTQLAKSEGVPVEQALKTFAKDLKKIDYVVGHFVAFDVGVITAECFRLGLPHPFEARPNNSRLLDSKSQQLKKMAGKRARKGPGLMRLHRMLFQESIQDKHNATRDVVATA